MKLQYLGLIGLAVICALCATLLVAFNKSAEETVSTDVSVVVAAKDLPPMTKITEDLCEVRVTPRGQAPKAALGSLPLVVGQVITVKLVKGQPFTDAVFAPEGSGFQVASTLPPGKRAVSIALADYSVLDGLLYPGCNVDVIAAFDMRTKGEAKQGVLSKTLLRNIMILAIENRTMATPKEEPTTARVGDYNRRRVTLQVDPEQAEMLQLAMVHGTISLAMRGPTDTAEVETRVTRLGDLGLPPELMDVLEPKVLTVAQLSPAQPAAVPAASEAPKPEPAKVAAKSEPTEDEVADEEVVIPMWETTVLRNGAPSTSTFPMPGADPTEAKKPAKAKPQAAKDK